MKHSKVYKILLFIIMITMCGCSLAAPQDEKEKTTSTLIGMFITFQPIEETESITATINKNNSNKASDWDFSFSDIEGISFYLPTFNDENGDPCKININNDISKFAYQVDISDNVETDFLSGTIYFTPIKNDSIIVYTHRVYQDNQGNIYLIPENEGIVISETSEGMQWSSTFSDEITDSDKVIKSDISLKIETILQPTSITIYQMDKNNQIVKQDTYDPDHMPEELTVNAEYLLLETKSMDLDGNIKISRSIHERDIDSEDDTLETYYPIKDGIVATHGIQVIWK